MTPAFDNFDNSELRDDIELCARLYMSGKIRLKTDEVRKCNLAIEILVRKIKRIKKISDVLKFLIVDVMDFSMTQVAIDLGLGESSVIRYVNGTRTPSFEIVLAICLYLKLPPRVTRAVLEKTRRNFLDGDERDAVYLILIDVCWASGDIVAINNILVDFRMKPLTPCLSD